MKTSKSFTNDGISKGNLINLESGRIPPQAIDLEEAVIGAMLIDKKGVDEVIDILTPEVFYKESNKLIFECVHNLFEESEPIDLLTVSSKLRKKGLLERIGGDFYLVQLSKKVSTSAHIEFHSRIILQKYLPYLPSNLRDLYSVFLHIIRLFLVKIHCPLDRVIQRKLIYRKMS